MSCVAWRELGNQRAANGNLLPPPSRKLPMQSISLAGRLTMDTPLVAIVTGAVSLLLLKQVASHYDFRTVASGVPSVLR